MEIQNSRNHPSAKIESFELQTIRRAGTSVWGGCRFALPVIQCRIVNLYEAVSKSNVNRFRVFGAVGDEAKPR